MTDDETILPTQFSCISIQEFYGELRLKLKLVFNLWDSNAFLSLVLFFMLLGTSSGQYCKYKLSRLISIHYLYYIMDPLNGVPLLIEMHTVEVSFQNPLPCRLLTDPLDD